MKFGRATAINCIPPNCVESRHCNSILQCLVENGFLLKPRHDNKRWRLEIGY